MLEGKRNRRSRYFWLNEADILELKRILTIHRETIPQQLVVNIDKLDDIQKGRKRGHERTRLVAAKELRLEEAKERLRVLGP